MIKRLEQELRNEERAKAEAMKPYNKRIRNLRTAINNLKQPDQTADEMNTERNRTVTKTVNL